MKDNIFILLLIILINLSFSIVPNWKFENSVTELISATETQYDHVIYNQNGFKLIKRITKNGDNSISSQNLLSINGGEYNSVNYEGIGSSYNTTNKQLNQDYLICPRGKFHPYNPMTNEVFIPTEFEEGGNWDLKCFTHKLGYFYVAYFGNGQRNFYGTKNKGGTWEHNYVRSAWFAEKLNEDFVTTNGNGNHYALLHISADGKWLKLTGAELVVSTTDNIDRPDVSQIDLFDFEIKDNTKAYISSSDDSFYYMTYNQNEFYSGYSLTPTITDYSQVGDNDNPIPQIVKHLVSPLKFTDNIEILQMDFILETKYIYYSLKNSVTGEIYHGIIEITSNKVIFNTDEEIISLTPDKNKDLLIVTPTSVYTLCLYKDNSNNCVQTCASDLVLNIEGNTCGVTSPSNCDLKLMPDDICIESCDTSIYILDGNQCGLCSDLDSSNEYKFINSDKCISSKPDNSEYVYEKYKILKCSSGYKLNDGKDACITNCYELCETCYDYSNNPDNQNCINCIEGYSINDKNCISQEREKEIEKEKEKEAEEEKEKETKMEKESEREKEVESPSKNCVIEKCNTCNAESLQLDLCITCNEALGYKKVNYTSYHPNFLDCKKRDDPLLKNFYYNELTEEYRPCYKTCKKCTTAGNSETHNCSECENGYMFRPGKNPYNNCVAYSKYFYLDAYNQFKSMDSLQCPLEAKYLVKDKNYCIFDCEQETTNKYLYNGVCLKSCPDGTTNDNYICKENPNKPVLAKSSIIIVEGNDDNYLKVVKTLAKIYISEFNYTENHVSLHENNNIGVIMYKNPSALEELPLEMPKVDFHNCSKNVKNNYNIEGNLLTSILEKKDKRNPETFYSFFHPISGELLESENLCYNETIVLTENLTSLLDINGTNFNLQMSLTEQGINIFDLNDPFYKDICYDFDNPNKRDIALRDRVKEVYPNAVLCEEGCRNKGIDLGDMTARCDCTFRDITHNKIVKENAILDSMVGEVLNVIDDSNILVVKCYKYIIKYFMRSFGGIVTSIIIILNLLLTLFFFFCQFRKISKYIINLTKKYIKFLNISSVKSKFEPKKRNDKIEKLKEVKRKSKRSTSRREMKTEKTCQDLKENENNENIKVVEYQDIDAVSEKKELKKFFKEYLTTSPDEMEFDDAIKRDKRSFCEYYLDNLKEKQMIANTFIADDPIKNRLMKLILFNLNLVLYIVINGLFFSEVYISKLYHIEKKDENFFSFLPRSIDRLIYSNIVSVFIAYLIDFFFIEEKKIIGIFKRDKESKEILKRNIIELVKELKRRYIGFVVFVFILLILFLYYLLCFNYVYPKSQIEWIKSSIAIIIITQILSILKIFAGAAFRYMSFCCNNEYVFRFSKVFN